jgi:hypothetical protein
MKTSLLIAGFIGFLSCGLRAAEPSEELKAALLKDSGGKLNWEREIVRPDGIVLWSFWLARPGWRGGKIPVFVAAGSDEQAILVAAMAANGVVDFEENYDREYAALDECARRSWPRAIAEASTWAKS